MDIRNLSRILGAFLTVFGAILLVPGAYGLAIGDPAWKAFLHSAIVSSGVGGLLFVLFRQSRRELDHRTGMAVVAFFWLSACLIGALPYVMSNGIPTYIDSFFESASGFSGTGASILTNIEGLGSSLLLWRSMTQWLGGMGIIVFFIAILPLLGVGGVHLFKAEVTGPSKDKITPRVRDTAKNLWFLYLAFTIVTFIALWAAGMSPFDAVTHAFTAVSTGGFSTKNIGVGAFDSAAIDFILSGVMILCAINFSLHYRFLLLRDRRAYNTTEFTWFLAIVVLFVGATTATNWISATYDSFFESFRHSLFVIAATISSTGYTNANYVTWHGGVQYLIILAMVMGGMSGATAGGVKCVRLVAAFKQLRNSLFQTVHPKAIVAIKSDRHSIPPEIVTAIWGFLFLYFFIFSLGTLVLVFEGADLISGATATISALSNIGPGLGSFGPLDNYAALSPLSKGVLIFCMFLGRLEFYTVLVLFTPAYWKH